MTDQRVLQVSLSEMAAVFLKVTKSQIVVSPYTANTYLVFCRYRRTSEIVAERLIDECLQVQSVETLASNTQDIHVLSVQVTLDFSARKLKDLVASIIKGL